MPMLPVMMDAPAVERPFIRHPVPAPLLLPAIGLMLGILADHWRPIPVWVIAALTVTAGAVAWRGRRHAAALGCAVFTLAAALGAVRHDLAFHRRPTDHVAHFIRQRTMLGTLRGVVADTPRTRTPDPERTPRAFRAEPRTRLTLAVDAWIDTRGVRHPASGKVLVTLAPARSDLLPGDEVEVFGQIYRIPEPANPGEYDRAFALRRNGVLVGLSADGTTALHLVARPPSAAASRALHAVRRRLAAALRDTGEDAADDSVGSVLEALVLAQRSQVERSINDAFVRTGNSHQLAASGMNVAWLALFVRIAVQPFRLDHRRIAALIFIAITLYGVLAEPNPPILRAVVMGDLVCIAVLLGRRFAYANWLAGAAIALLLANPGVLFGADFQLSFAVLIALGELSPVVCPPVRSAICRLLRVVEPPKPEPDAMFAAPAADAPPAPELPLHVTFRLELARLLAWPLAFAISAWLGGLPLVARHFGSIAPWGWLASALLSPFAFATMLLGFAKLALAIILPSSAVWTGPLLNGLVQCMNHFVERLATLPGTLLPVAAPSPVGLVMMYGLLAAWAKRAAIWDSLLALPPRLPERFATPADALIVRGLRLSPRVQRIGPAALGGVLFALPLLFAPRPGWLREADSLRVWTLAVGDGTATLIELPNGRTLLYDAGTRSNYDPAAWSIAPFLRWRGIRQIDVAFVSHPDLDHFSAIESLIESVPIRRLILNAHFESFAAGQPAAERFVARMRAAGVPIDVIAAPWRLPDSGAAQVEALWPPPAGSFINNDNNSSTVLRIAFAGRAMLLTGDITQYAMDQLVEQASSDATAAVRLGCDVLHLPHHGGLTESTAAFIDATGAAICIRSSAQRDELTVNGLLELMAGRRYFNTADDGCVEVQLGRAGATAKAWRKREP